MKIKFKTRHVYGKSIVSPSCPRSEALFRIIGKSEIDIKDIREVSRMGFEIEFCGEVKEMSSQLKLNDIAHERVPGRVTIHHPSDIKRS